MRNAEPLALAPQLPDAFVEKPRLGQRVVDAAEAEADKQKGWREKN